MGKESEREYSVREYVMRFGYSGCPVCGSKRMRIFEREKQGVNYKIYACGYCKYVIKREFTE